MNIRVDLEIPIRDGTEVVFRSPVDCSQVTGLIVYYKENGNTTSKVFAFADAHGNNVGDIDHLFAENVVVKVILDVTTSMAFVQNADTNAYLEWRFKDTIDKLAPSFAESGTAVRCEPVEGYPLKVVTERPTTEVNSITLTQCGKNLFDCAVYTFQGKYVHSGTGNMVTSSSYNAIEDYMPIGHLKGQIITLNHPPAEKNKTTNAGLAFYDAGKAYISGSNDHTHVIPDNAEYMRFSYPRELADGTNIKAEDIQIELGSVVKECEPYRGMNYTAEAADVVHKWSGVKAIAGVNTIWSSVGTTTVEGKSNPAAIIEKLTNAIIALGGNV